MTSIEALPTGTALTRLVHDLGGAVLRNADVVENLGRGGDVDVLVPDLVTAEAAARRILGGPLFVARRSYVWSLHYSWGHIDLSPTVEWRGACYLDTAAILRRRRRGDGPDRVDPVDEAIICWFASVLWGGFFKERYRQLIQQVAREDPDGLHIRLQYALGRRWAKTMRAAAVAGQPELAATWTAQLRRAVRRRAFARNPGLLLRRWALFWACEMGLRLRPPLPWVAVLGPDGSGKSTAIEALENTWPRALGQVVRHHWRPHSLSRAGEVREPVVDPHGRPPRGRLMSMVKLVWFVVDWHVGFRTKIAHARAHNGLVVFDRHYLDLLVDPRRYRYGGSKRLATAVAHFVPQPDVLVGLDAPVDVLHGRKREVTEAEAERQRTAYRQLVADHPKGVLIDSRQGPEQIALEIHAAVLAVLASRTRCGPAHCPVAEMKVTK